MANKCLYELIEIETSNKCNRDCSWCVYGEYETYRNRQIEYLETETIKNVVNDIRDIGFNGILSLFSINEPLMDERICDGTLIKLCKDIICDQAKIHLVTNGDFLTKQIMNTMIDAGLDCFGISCYDEKIYKKAIDFKNTYKDKVNLRIYDYRNNNMLYVNRAGSLAKDLKKANDSCFLPMFQTVIGWDGEIRVCTNENLGKIKIGNVKNTSFKDIINNKEYKRLQKLIAINCNSIYPCNQCNYPGNFFPSRKEIDKDRQSPIFATYKGAKKLT